MMLKNVYKYKKNRTNTNLYNFKLWGQKPRNPLFTPLSPDGSGRIRRMPYAGKAKWI